MKTLLFSILFLGLSFTGATQDFMSQFIKWNCSVEKIDESHANLVFSGKLIPEYHIFSIKHDPMAADGTGIVPEFKFKANKNFKTIGKVFELGTPLVQKDELGTSLYFENKAVFKQKIEILSTDAFSVSCNLFFQLCNHEGCLPPFDYTANFKVSSGYEASGAISEIVDTSSNEQATNSDTSAAPITAEQGSAPIQQKEKKKDSNVVIFIAGFIAGLVALLTPCMFPMIPMTVTFFTKQSKTRSEGIFKALIYGASIVLIYVAFGLIFTAIMGPLGLNDLSTNVWMNLIFFSIFVLFAFSFLGAFEIQLPNSWVNKMDKQADRGGYLGIFFMAFTLGLVSFSCTGPIIGSLLVEAATSGSYLTPAVGMTGFSLALAIPFTLFAIFPGWLNSLPQSGGWLNSVKVVLGLTELALALKFLSSVDLAYHWGLLTREWFIGIWFVLFFIMGIYLLGKLQFSHDSPVQKLSVTRFMFALIALVFSVYLFTGMFGAPLTLIDGIAPPRTHSEDNFRWVNGGQETGLVEDSVSAAFATDMHPVGDGSILVFHDIEKGRAYAKKRNLPILLDFTGHACQNCRKTESTVWTSDEIRPLLQKQFVIISLYVDDRELLPASQQRISKLSGPIRTVGNKWADYQMSRYKSFQQPLYVVTDHQGNDLTLAIGYTPNITSYKKFLEGGIERFQP